MMTLEATFVHEMKTSISILEGGFNSFVENNLSTDAIWFVDDGVYNHL
jgi:hypothetical protein